MSSNKAAINNNIRTYSDTLKTCGLQGKTIFIPKTPCDSHANEKCKRRRKITWFVSPCSINIKTNSGKLFQIFYINISPLPPHSTKYLIETQLR